jgi:hypothetical protein
MATFERFRFIVFRVLLRPYRWPGTSSSSPLEGEQGEPSNARYLGTVLIGFASITYLTLQQLYLRRSLEKLPRPDLELYPGTGNQPPAPTWKSSRL